ncbi:MAG: amidohydrolase family protein [Deltaproteobacteria bacterium]|nr:amidohydrolase family protein [Deltaproteobacteria bacterium]
MQKLSQPDNILPRNLIRAARIVTMVPEQPLLSDGALLTQTTAAGDRIIAVGNYHSLKNERYQKLVDLGPVTIGPGLINAHTHLELSHLAGRTIAGQGFVAWLKSLVPHLNIPPRDNDLLHALAGMRLSGTVFAADMADRHAARLETFLEKNDFAHWLMIQHFGFAAPDSKGGMTATTAEKLNPELAVSKNFCRAGHAFYSTAATTLQAAKAWDRRQHRPFALHLAESQGESELLSNGRGQLADFFREAGILPPEFQAPGCSPVAFADQLKLLDKMTLAIHCVELTQSDIEILARRRVNVCLCPRSNAFIGVGRAPFAKMLQAKINLCLGTDSLTSNHDLNLWHELEFLQHNVKTNLNLQTSLAMLTRNPAQALALNHDYGTLEPGKIALWSVIPAQFL